MAIRIAKRWDKNSVDVRQIKVIKDEDGRTLTDDAEINPFVPDGLPVEAWKCFGKWAIGWLQAIFNSVLETRRMPDDWRSSIIIPICKNKGNVQDCGNYHGIKLTSHTLKIWERVIDVRLRTMVHVGEEQFDFMPNRSTTDAIFILRQIIEKHRERQENLHCTFIDLEKAYNRVPREELWACMREAKIPESYVRVVQDMYKWCTTRVRTACGETEEFKVTVRLQNTSGGRTQTGTELWRHALERRGMRVSWKKTEYLCTGGGQTEEGTIKFEDVQVNRVKDFKYLGSTVQEDGGTELVIARMIQSGWNSWKKITDKVKGKLHRLMVRPAMLYGLETVPLTKSQEGKLEVAEMRMMRF
ncbi:uncharacterized protein LOC134767573 [Penaeus indicus]|uniref:uncharacterized protein LOC134767573 n=1 Tax=Penaeus indicus TaxID=29960 RepID=UPI00300D5F2F